jgi:tape measure domain-containing protein
MAFPSGIGGGTSSGGGVNILIGSLSVDLTQINTQMNQAVTLVNNAVTNFNTASNQVGSLRGFDILGDSIAGVGMKALAGGAGVIALGGAIIKLGQHALETFGFLEQTQVGMLTFTGSVEKAGKMLDDVLKFAVNTPFDVKGLIAAQRQLIALNFEVDKTPKMLHIMSDALSATGLATEERMDRLVKAFGAMNNRGALAMRELNTLSANGIAAQRMLADQMGVATEDLAKVTKNRLLSGAQAVEMLLRQMQKEYAGAAEMQSQTLLGRMQNLEDAATRTLFKIGKVIEPISKSIVEALYGVLATVEDLTDTFTKLDPITQTAIISAAAMAAGIAVLIPVFAAVAVAVGAMLTPIGSAVVVLSAFAIGFAALAGAVSVAWPGLVAVWDALIEDLSRIGMGFSTLYDEVFGQAARDRLDAAIKGLGKVFDPLKKAFGAVWDFTVETFGKMPQFAQDAFAAVGAGISGFIAALWDSARVMVRGMGAILQPGLALLVGIVDLFMNAVREKVSFMDALIKKVGQAIASIGTNALPPGLQQAVQGLQYLAKAYGNVFDEAMRAATGGKGFLEVLQDKFAAFKAGLPSMEKFNYKLNEMADKSKKAAKDLQELGNAFLSWAAAQTRAMDAEARFTTVQKQAVRDRLDSLREFNAVHSRTAIEQLAGLELLGRTEVAFTGTMSEQTGKRIALLKAYLEAANAANKGAALNSAIEDFGKLNIVVDKGSATMAGFSTNVDALINKGWKRLGVDMKDTTRLLGELNKELGTSLTVEDPASKVERIIAAYNKIASTGQFTIAKMREIWTASFEAIKNAINKAADEVHVLDAGFTNFATVKLRAVVVNLEDSLIKMSKGIQTGVSDALAKSILDWKNAGSIMTSLWKSISGEFSKMWKNTLNGVVHIFTDAIGQMVGLVFDVFADAFKSVLNGIIGQFIDIEAMVGKITKRVTTELVPAIAGTATRTGTGATGAVTGATGATGGATSLFGAINVVTGAVSALFNALSYFQGRRMEQDIGRMEVTLREIKNILLDVQKAVERSAAGTEHVDRSTETMAAALSNVGDWTLGTQLAVEAVAAMIHNHLLPKMDSIAAALGGANITVNSTGGATIQDVMVVNYPMLVEPLLQLQAIDRDGFTRVTDAVNQQVARLNENMTSGDAIIVSALQVGFKSVINALIAGRGGTQSTTVGVDAIGSHVTERLLGFA